MEGRAFLYTGGLVLVLKSGKAAGLVIHLKDGRFPLWPWRKPGGSRAEAHPTTDADGSFLRRGLEAASSSSHVISIHVISRWTRGSGSPVSVPCPQCALLWLTQPPCPVDAGTKPSWSSHMWPGASGLLVTSWGPRLCSGPGWLTGHPLETYLCVGGLATPPGLCSQAPGTPLCRLKDGGHGGRGVTWTRTAERHVFIGGGAPRGVEGVASRGHGALSVTWTRTVERHVFTGGGTSRVHGGRGVTWTGTTDRYGCS